MIIKAQKFRSLEKNRTEALRRLEELIERVRGAPSAIATQPTRVGHPQAGGRRGGRRSGARGKGQRLTGR